MHIRNAESLAAVHTHTHTHTQYNLIDKREAVNIYTIFMYFCYAKNM